MSAKRGAQSELTHDNWDEEEGSEDRGTFAKANENEISRRVIKIGRRRSQQNPAATSNIFSGFTGFKSNPTDASSNTSFNSSSLFPNLNKTVPATLNSNSKKAVLNGGGTSDSDHSLTEANNNHVSNSDHSEKSDFGKDSAVLTKYKDTSDKFERERHSKVFQHKLASLNKSVVSWITKHVDENACVDLTPIFNDYKNHLEQIDSEYKKALSELKDESVAVSSGITESKAVEQKSAFGFLNKSSSDTKANNTQPMIFGASFNSGGSTSVSSIFTLPKTPQSTDASSKLLTSSGDSKETESTKPSIFAGLNSSTSNGENSIKPLGNLFAPLNKTEDLSTGTKPNLFTGFGAANNTVTGAMSFTGNLFKTASDSGTESTSPKIPAFAGFGVPGVGTQGSIFGVTSKAPETTGEGSAQENNKTEETPESDEPPKNEFTVVEEPDAYYSIRCKLFFRKGADWISKGVGMLYFKQIDGGKTQLVMRADTNLGNIILNIILDSEAPIKKSGKNIVSMVTVANPPVEEKCSECGKGFVCAQESNKCLTPGCIPKPTPLMFKVKAESDCDQLVDKLKNPKVD